MKAKPVKNIGGRYEQCAVEEATHVSIRIPGPTGLLTLPIITHGKREGTGCWTWNGNTELPKLVPSLLTSHGELGVRCHCWIDAGQAEFLPDTTHAHAGKRLPLLDVE